MSGLKKFLDRRAEGIAREKAKKDGAVSKKEKEEDPNLTDEEFWTITNQYIIESKNTKGVEVEILQKILEQYTPLKIEQFAKRYEELNK